MSSREADFVTYPGSGMWMMCTKSENAPGMYLYRRLDVKTIKGIVEAGVYKLFWIDTGIGAANLLSVRQGRKSASATEVTPRVLAQYLK